MDVCAVCARDLFRISIRYSMKELIAYSSECVCAFESFSVDWYKVKKNESYNNNGNSADAVAAANQQWARLRQNEMFCKSRLLFLVPHDLLISCLCGGAGILKYILLCYSVALSLSLSLAPYSFYWTFIHIFMII